MRPCHKANLRGETKSARNTYFSEPSSLFTEKGGLGDATRVHARKNNPSILMVSSVEFRNRHHVANLAKVVDSEDKCTKKCHTKLCGTRSTVRTFESLYALAPKKGFPSAMAIGFFAPFSRPCRFPRSACG